ncbi:DUF2281 domain-containing protein [Pedobacter sp. AW1-32]|uniref:type II toxin-antitoxin system VapB family antitoxin n=1 Tax=Pedobacter sp. AW1-32 TaxID=3383026 RepID=UPI003FEDC415
MDKLDSLPEDKLAEVEDFVDFLKARYERKSYTTPLEQTQIAKEPKSLYGAAKDTVLYISDDFNEPLDDLKDYM